MLNTTESDAPTTGEHPTEEPYETPPLNPRVWLYPPALMAAFLVDILLGAHTPWWPSP